MDGKAQRDGRSGCSCRLRHEGGQAVTDDTVIAGLWQNAKIVIILSRDNYTQSSAGNFAEVSNMLIEQERQKLHVTLPPYIPECRTPFLEEGSPAFTMLVN